MKNKLICYKNLKNNKKQIIKIYNNIFNCYIQTFYDYFLKLNETINSYIINNLRIFYSKLFVLSIWAIFNYKNIINI